MADDRPILVLDSASPVVSVAVAAGGELLADATLELRRSSERLLATVEEVLATAGCTLGGVAGVAALQGPGSFTGLRIGLATVLGFHQALGLPATALPTLPVIAAAAAGDGTEAAGPPATVVAAVDAMRGDWSVQPFRIVAGAPPRVEPLAAAERRPGSELAELAPCRLAGFDVGRLADEPQWRDDAGIELFEPPPLAPVAARWISADGVDWDPALLTAPIYFRPPAVTLPKKRRGG